MCCLIKEGVFMFQSMRYFDVYVLCQAASKLLMGGFERNVNDFFEPIFEGNDEQIQFNKYSLLHNYCEWVVRQNVWDEEEDIVPLIRDAHRLSAFTHKEGTLWIDRAINHYCQSNSDFLLWIKENSTKSLNQMTDTEVDDLRYDYLCNIQLCEDFYTCVTHVSNEMFYVLFQNREFLYNFNGYLSTYNSIRQNRISIPLWAQRSVFFRDHGCCVFCGKDLSGTIHITQSREIHYDHIIPLSQHGINDVSNLQLSCSKCNLVKSEKSTTSVKYQQWYDMDNN